MSDKRDNSGALFKNQRKEADSHADYTGNCMIDGKEYWINAWLKEGANGKFFSFSFRPKEQKSKYPPKQERFEHESRRIEPEIPF